jgi:hypothetical protein
LDFIKSVQVSIGHFIGSIIKAVLSSIKFVEQNSIGFCQAAKIALFDELSKADFVLDANEVVKYHTVKCQIIIISYSGADSLSFGPL